MEEKIEKSKQIVKSIKLLEGVLKTSPNAAQRSRVKKDIESLRNMLKDMYPDADLRGLEDAIYSDSMTLPEKRESTFETLESLREVEVEVVSPYRDDMEINEAAGIMKYFEDRIWGVISDQHLKLDFSNSGERDTLYRKLDECNRAFKMFCQTIEDIDKTKSSEYLSQLQLMRIRQGRLFLFDLYEFFKSARNFISNLISDSDFGGTMILNPEEKVVYADYEKYRMFEGINALDAMKYMKKFISEALEVINVPEIKNK